MYLYLLVLKLDCKRLNILKNNKFCTLRTPSKHLQSQVSLSTWKQEAPPQPTSFGMMTKPIANTMTTPTIPQMNEKAALESRCKLEEEEYNPVVLIVFKKKKSTTKSTMKKKTQVLFKTKSHPHYKIRISCAQSFHHMYNCN